MPVPAKRPPVPVVDAEFKVVRRARRPPGPARRPLILEAHLVVARVWFATALVVVGLMLVDFVSGGMVGRTVHHLLGIR